MGEWIDFVVVRFGRYLGEGLLIMGLAMLISYHNCFVL